MNAIYFLMLPVLKYNGLEIAKDVEFARNRVSQMFGLMFRTDIPPDFAKIFVLKKPSSVNVHMLFMLSPIDVIFLDKEKKISGLVRLNPWVGFKAMKNIRYVIEMKSGTIDRYNLAIGEQMEFEDE